MGQRFECQFGNRGVALKLIDYDGIHVPALSGRGSPEAGHPAFQHPRRSCEGIYSAEVDRFSHLAIYTAIQCLTVGRESLWQRFNNDDNLLFREGDFEDPSRSDLFHSLWELPDAESRSLVGRLVLACRGPLGEVPLLSEVTEVPDGEVFSLSRSETEAVTSLLAGGVSPVPLAAPGMDEDRMSRAEATVEQKSVSSPSQEGGGTGPAEVGDSVAVEPGFVEVAAPVSFPRLSRRQLQWGLVAVVPAILLLGIVLLMGGDHGRVRIALSPVSADVQMTVDGTVLERADLDDPLKLEPGDHELVADVNIAMSAPRLSRQCPVTQELRAG